jgi:hypothetical protein
LIHGCGAEAMEDWILNALIFLMSALAVVGLYFFFRWR